PASLFFCAGFGDHPDLHAFPTRRSSDLLGLQLGAFELLGARPHLEGVDRGLAADNDLVDASFEVHRRGGGLAEVEDLLAVESHGDRKSTRLNSSHVKISYAVFCLKKKKE